MLYLILICLGYINPAVTLYCYWNTGCPYKYLSTETPYDSVRGDIRDSTVRLKGCEPTSIWGIYRHGKRQPNAILCEQMKNAINIRDFVVSSYKKHRSSLCAQDVENLLNWSLDKKLLDGKQDLTEEGINEMVGLGKRLKEAFPILLSDVGNSNYTFRSAKGPWIEKSIKYFVKGLGSNKIKIDDPKPDTDVMAPNCDHQIEKITNQRYSEVEKFISSSDYLAVKDRIQRRTGIEYSLSDVNVSALYDLCRYTWSDKVSPWCALFTTEDLQVLEYIEDLKHYYKNGYGDVNNEIMGRIPLADLFKVFEEVKGGRGKSVVAYVTSDTILDQIYTALRLFKDGSPLTAASRNRDRKWRTSKLSVFSANLVAALYRCDNDSKQEYNVVFYLNEEPIRTICEEGVCSWQEFESKFGSFLSSSVEVCKKPVW